MEKYLVHWYNNTAMILDTQYILANKYVFNFTIQKNISIGKKLLVKRLNILKKYLSQLIEVKN